MLRFVRAVFSAAVLPATLSGALMSALISIERGSSPAPLVPIAFVGCALWVALLERWIPFRRDWNVARGDVTADAIYLPITSFVVVAMRASSAYVAALAAEGVSRSALLPIWPDDWSLGAQIPLAWLVVEFFAYWPHRLLHEVPMLWRLHATHHSAERLYWLNATRAHPLEHVLRGFVSSLPLALVGASPELIALSLISDSVIGLFQHANVDLRLGPLNFVFSAAPVHRWHHARSRGEADHNYGDSFIVWDLVFGTYYAPRDRAVGELGIEGLEAFPRSFMGQLVAPLRWSRILAASSGKEVVRAALLVLISCSALLPDATHAQAAPDPRALMEAVDRRDRGGDQVMKSTWRLIRRSGQERVRVLRSYWKDYRSGAGGVYSKRVVIFESPPDLEDTSFLIVSHRDPSRDDDRWVYLPALRKVRRIAGRDRGGSFFGSEFAYEDLAERDASEDAHALVRSENRAGRLLHVVDSTPREPGFAYSKRRQWIDAADATVVRVEFFVAHEQLKKHLDISWQRVDGIWAWRELEMQTVASGARTIVEVGEVRHGAGLADAIFSDTTLRLGPPRVR
jgi:sterol desaturase/sphingolipid hydroxylase (fatty acid hydroxylase superfamily)